MKLQVLKLKHLSKVYRKLTDGILQQICVGKHFLLFDELAGQEQHSYISQDPHLADLMNWFLQILTI